MAESNFIDYVRIFCASGHGGAGSAHLHRAKYVPKGGPDGGTCHTGRSECISCRKGHWSITYCPTANYA